MTTKKPIKGTLQLRHIDGSLTHGAAVMKHLYGITNTDNYTRSPATTEDGIGAAVGISRAHASIVVKKLTNLGFLTAELAHCGEKRRRYCFQLTDKGRAWVRGKEF